MSSNLSINRVCEYCKNPFVAKTTRTRFCSSICNGRNNKMLIRNLKIKDSDLETLSKANEKSIEKIEEIKNKDFLTVKDASQLLNISTKTLYRLIERKEINSFSFSTRKTLIRRKDIDTYFDNNLKEIQKSIESPEIIINLDNSYTIQEAQEKYNISSAALYNLIIRFKIPKKKQGKYTLVRKEDIDSIFN
ncbi:helix-turn-helix domain-containing protein [Flavobacterium maritimum]|uniref:helix-turn-helix domain-containing protein n=1 Tax=Flavobacterium maritimum TaxID=3149042 RepID=UPI0032B3D3FC